MQNEVTVAVVNFHAVWGEVDRNLDRIEGFAREAAGQGAQVLLFPETAVSGYDLGDGDGAEMHRNAASRTGEVSARLAELARELGVYLVCGLPEQDALTGAVYNAALAAAPEGLLGFHRKLHLPLPEAAWAVTGRSPLVFDSPWGPIGVGICYDTYWFPEVARHCAALGARLYLNPTAIYDVADWRDIYLNQVQARALENCMFVASANLFGRDRVSYFPGGSAVVGPGESLFPRLWAGPELEREGPLLARLDLSRVDAQRARLPLFGAHPRHGRPDWRPDLYAGMLADVRSRPEWRARLEGPPETAPAAKESAPA